MIELTTWSSRYNTIGWYKELSWETLCKLLSVPKVVCYKNNLGGFNCGRFIGNKRSSGNFISSTALVLEYDSGKLFIPEILEFWKTSKAFIYTTFSHTVNYPRVRIILPTSRTVSSIEYTALWGFYNELCKQNGHLVDQTAKDAGRFWYCPGIRSGAAFESHVLTGSPIDVDSILQRYPIVVPKTIPVLVANDLSDVRRYARCIDPAVSGNYGRRATFVAALKVLSFNVTEVQTLEILMDEWNDRCTPKWSAGELAKIISAAARRRNK